MARPETTATNDFFTLSHACVSFSNAKFTRAPLLALSNTRLIMYAHGCVACIKSAELHQEALVASLVIGVVKFKC